LYSDIDKLHERKYYKQNLRLENECTISIKFYKITDNVIADGVLIQIKLGKK